MDESLVQLITDLVIAELSKGVPEAPPVCAGPTEPRRRILLCPAAGAALDTWQALKGVQGVEWLAPSDCAERCANHLGRPVRGVNGDGGWDELVSGVESLVIPFLSLELLAKLALLIADRPAVAAALAGVVQGKPVLASSQEPDRVRRASGRLPGAFLSAYQRHLRDVEGLGIQLLEPAALAARLANKAVAVSSSSRGRDVVTAEDLQAVVRAGQKQLLLAPGSIVTPLARDMAVQLGIEVKFA